MSGQWHQSVSFADRLTVTSKIKSAYEAANPYCSASEASSEAKSREESARKTAESLREYHEICAQTVQTLLEAVQKAVSEPKSRVAQDISGGEADIPNGTETGTSIGRYYNAQYYKSGLFSEIFKASSPDGQTSVPFTSFVALKVTTPSVMTPPHDSKREARILNAAKGDSIVPIIDTFQQPGGRFVMVLPFMPHDLNTLLHRRQLPRQSQRPVLRDIFSGLTHIHKLGIIHRDIKPSNILLSNPKGPAVIADFGIAWSPSDQTSEPADEKILDVGTTSYRPPELLFGKQCYDTSLDLWAAGCVAAQITCLDGRTLFDAGDLGSELALIKSIFETLGTPDVDVWPEASTLPDWGKMNFRIYPGMSWDEILPGAESDAIEFVRNLVVYESSHRLRVEEALKHRYLQESGT